MKKCLIHFVLGMGSLVLLTNAANAQWVKTNGPWCGNIGALAVSGGTIYAGTNSGIFLSTDNGANWTGADSGLKNTDVHSLAASGSAVFAGTWGGGVYLSTDNGVSWTEVDSGLPANSYVASLGVSGSAVFAGVWDYARHAYRVFLSVNNGANWTAADFGLTNMNVQSLAVSGSGTVFAGTDASGVYLSTDNGTNWIADNSGLTSSNVQSLAVSSSGTVFAGTFGGGVFLSTHDGTSWTAVNSGLTDMYIHSLAAVRGSQTVFAGTDSGRVFLSTDNGVNWTAVNSDLASAMVRSLVVSDGAVFAGTWGEGVWRRPLSDMAGTIGSKRQQGKSGQAYLKICSPGRTNPNVTIEVSLPHSVRVIVGIYDLQGREITSLVDKNLGPGTYGLPWQAGNMAAGCYTVRMRAGSNTFAKSVPVFR